MAPLTRGQRITQERKKLGLSQEGLGEKIGVSRQSISKWEQGTATPEIEKLIALSKLFGVSVGWLLGVEELPEEKGNELSDIQLKVVDQLVRQSQPHRRWRAAAAMALAAIALLTSLVTAWQLHDDSLRSQAAENQLTSQLQDIGSRLAVLESAVLSSGNQLLSGHTLSITPTAGYSDAVKALVQFSATPKAWLSGDTGYLCVSGGSLSSIRQPCAWDGTHLTASVTLDVEGLSAPYQLCFTVEHENGSQEQQLLQSDIIDDLTRYFTVPIHIDPGAYSFENGTLTLTDFTAAFDLPPIYFEPIPESSGSQSDPTAYISHMVSPPTVAHCEYYLIRNPGSGAPSEILTANMADHYTYAFLPGESYRIQGHDIQFQNVDIACDHLQLWFRVTFSNGLENKSLITLLVPDGNGDFREL